MKKQAIQTLVDYQTKDMWWEARKHTASIRQPWWMQIIIWVLLNILGVRTRILRFGTAQSVLCVDLNHWRPDIDVKRLIDMGVKVFMLRVGGPKNWVYPMVNVVDETFVPYYNLIRAYAKEKGVQVWIIGYCVHNPFSNAEGNYLGLDPQVAWFKEATRNHQCDAYCWDDEVAKCWMNGKETTITPVNLVKSISICMQQTWDEMERWPNGFHKMVVHYSANWFMKTYAPVDYRTWLDNNNKDVNNRKFATWRAWYPQTFTEVFATVGGLFEKLISPTGIQENTYLRMGSELAADLWQASDRAKGDWCGPLSQAGCDVSISYGPSATILELVPNFNWTFAVTDVTPPQQPGMLTGYQAGGKVYLQWTASLDDVATVGYEVTRDTVKIGTVTELVFSELQPAEGAHIYTVTAFDKAGNHSEPATVTVSVSGTQPAGDYITRAEFEGHSHQVGGPINKV